MNTSEHQALHGSYRVIDSPQPCKLGVLLAMSCRWGHASSERWPGPWTAAGSSPACLTPKPSFSSTPTPSYYHPELPRSPPLWLAALIWESLEKWPIEDGCGEFPGSPVVRTPHFCCSKNRNETFLINRKIRKQWTGWGNNINRPESVKQSWLFFSCYY